MQFHIREQIEDYLAGRLAELQEREQIERHIRSCSSCRQALREDESSRWYLQWLMLTEAPPAPGPDFYVRVRQSIEQRKSSGWLGNLAAALHPRLAYPLVFMMLMLAAWTVTIPASEMEEVTPLEALTIEFASISFPDSDQNQNRDLVMDSLVEVAEAK
ncbi:MAG: zf-HC2 domain-containing protein [Acidobacteria bacterium]|nr:zf-HC2 domain-containing protein [Acidobacteriota bacterium]